MTRIMRMRLPVWDSKEWVSVLSGKGPNSYLIIAENGEEFEITDNGREPVEAQITKALRKRTSARTQ